VSPIFSEITSHSVVRTSCSTVCGVPLRLNVDDIAVMACGSGAADELPVASTLRRNGDTSAGAATAPATMPVATLALMKFLRVNFAMRFLFRASVTAFPGGFRSWVPARCRPPRLADRRTAPEPIRSYGGRGTVQEFGS
jgi:hypothetical protein